MRNENGFDFLLDRLISQSGEKPYSIAAHSHIGNQHLSRARQGKAHLSEVSALRIAETLHIDPAHQREFVLLACGYSIQRVKKELGASFYEYQLPVRTR